MIKTMNLPGTPEEVLAEVQAIFKEVVPTAVCELQDYAFRIGCGDLAADGQIQEVVFMRKHLTREATYHGALQLRRKLGAAER